MTRAAPSCRPWPSLAAAAVPRRRSPVRRPRDGRSRRPAWRRLRGSASHSSCDGRRHFPGNPAPRNGCAPASGRRPHGRAAARRPGTWREGWPVTDADRRNRRGPAVRSGQAGGTFAAQLDERGIAVRHHRRHAVQRAAQDHHDEALLGRRGGQRQRCAPESECRGKAKQGATAGELQHHRLWNSGEENSRVSASRREPARCSLQGCRRAAAGPGWLRRVPRHVARADAARHAVGPVDPAHHRFGCRPVAARSGQPFGCGAVGMADPARPGWPGSRTVASSSSGKSSARSTAMTKSRGVRSLLAVARRLAA